MKICGVYLIISPTGKRYVGSSNDIHKRWNRYKNLSCKNQSYLYNSLKKHGHENHRFIVLIKCVKEDKFYWERVFGDMYRSLSIFENGLNLVLPGYQDVPAIFSNDFKEKISKIQKNRFQNQKERQRVSILTKNGFTKEVKEKLSKVHKERFLNVELRKKRSFERKEYYKNNPEAKIKASLVQKDLLKNNLELKNKAISALENYYKKNPNIRSVRMQEWIKNNPERFKKVGQKNRERFLKNPELRKIVSEKTKAQLSINHHNARSVVNIKTGEKYRSVIDVSKITGIPIQTIRNWLNGKSPNKSFYKYE